MNQKPERLTLIAFVVSTILGGNSSIAVRFSNVEVPPFFGAAIRFAVSSLILFVVIYYLHLPLPKGRSLTGVLFYGVLQFGAGYSLIYWGLLKVPAGVFQVILALVPLLTFCFAIAHRQESFQWRILLGGLLATVGIAVVFRDRLGADIPLLSLLAPILTSACSAESNVLFKTLPKAHPITTTAFAMGMGSMILFVVSRLSHETPKIPQLPATWIAAGYLILFGSIATFVLSLYVLSHWTASAGSYQLVLMPIVTILFASWIAHEELTSALLIGGLLVLGGVYIGALMPQEVFKKFVFSKHATQKLDKAE